MKKVFAILMSVLMVAALFAGCGEGNKPAADNNTIKIGMTGPLTGEAAIYGTAVEAGMKIAVEEINAAAGENGLKIEFKAVDDEHIGDKAVTGYNTLMDWGMQFFAGTVTTGPALAVAPECAADSIFMLTPYSTPMMEKLMPLLEDESLLQDAAALEAAMLEVMDSVLVPLLVIFLLVFLVLALPVSYRLRMADRCLLDAPEEGALHAMRQSTRLTKGNCLKLVKLDLSFWWFYLLDALVTAVAYGDLILGAVTEKSSDVTYFGFFGLYLLYQLGLYCWRRNQVETTYALAYEALRAPREPAPAPQPGTQPWNYE